MEAQIAIIIVQNQIIIYIYNKCLYNINALHVLHFKVCYYSNKAYVISDKPSLRKQTTQDQISPSQLARVKRSYSNIL